MSAAEVLRRLRLLLLLLSALLFVGTLVELWLVNHTEDFIQWVAFILVGLGLFSLILVLVLRRRKTILVLRTCMLLVVLGSLFGVYEHVVNNIEFQREIQPNSTSGELAWKGLSGANPLLAPGTLAIAAIMALAGAYRYEVTGDDPR